MDIETNQKSDQLKYGDVFSMVRSMGREDDLILINHLTGRPRRSFLGRIIGYVRGCLLNLRSTTFIEQRAEDMSSICAFSGDHWVIASHTFFPRPWIQITVMGSGLTLVSAQSAYQLALRGVVIPQRHWWMWWRRSESGVDTPFIGTGIT